jgi:hypothetical protein
MSNEIKEFAGTANHNEFIDKSAHSSLEAFTIPLDEDTQRLELMLAGGWGDTLRYWADNADQSADRNAGSAGDEQKGIRRDGLLFFGIGLPAVGLGAWGLSSLISPAHAEEVVTGGGVELQLATANTTFGDTLPYIAITGSVLAGLVALMMYKSTMWGIERKERYEKLSRKDRADAARYRKQADDADAEGD